MELEMELDLELDLELLEEGRLDGRGSTIKRGAKRVGSKMIIMSLLLPPWHWRQRRLILSW